MADLHTSLIEKPIIIGEPVRLSSRVRRITAPNPSMMTGPGTNTYLVGDGDHVAVIDPGPNIDQHIDAIMQACEGKIRWVIPTHTHEDHSPAAKPLAQLSGAELVGLPHPGYIDQLDETFQPAWHIQDGESLCAPTYTLQAVYTPGHVANHVSYLLVDERWLFAGDHVMQGASVAIISRHGGTMWDYLASLQKVRAMEVDVLAPAHGHLLGQARRVLDELYLHRLKREQMAIDALRALGKANLAELRPLVYPEFGTDFSAAVDVALTAHMRKLEHDGVALLRHQRHWLEAEDCWEFNA